MNKAIAAAALVLSLVSAPVLAGQPHGSQGNNGAVAGGGTANANANVSRSGNSYNVVGNSANAQNFTGVGISVRTGGAKSSSGGGSCWGWGC